MSESKHAIANAVKHVKHAKRSYVEKMLRKYEFSATKRAHDLRRKVSRNTKNWALEV